MTSVYDEAERLFSGCGQGSYQGLLPGRSGIKARDPALNLEIFQGKTCARRNPANVNVNTQFYHFLLQNTFSRRYIFPSPPTLSVFEPPLVGRSPVSAWSDFFRGSTGSSHPRRSLQNRLDLPRSLPTAFSPLLSPSFPVSLPDVSPGLAVHFCYMLSRVVSCMGYLQGDCPIFLSPSHRDGASVS